MGFFKKKTDKEIERETRIYLEKEKSRQAFIKAKNDRTKKIKKLRDLRSKNSRTGRFLSGVTKVADSFYSNVQTKQQPVKLIKKKKQSKKQNEVVILIKQETKKKKSVQQQPKKQNKFSVEDFEKKINNLF